MEHPISTISFPGKQHAKREKFCCGAFYNLYRCIGDNRNGVPSTDTDSNYEWAEMAIAAWHIVTGAWNARR